MTMEKILRCVSLTALCFAGYGCISPVSTVQRPESFVSAQPQVFQQPAVSLFAGDAEVLSDQAIADILGYQYQPPALSRIAIMPFGQEVWTTWSSEFLVVTDELKQNLIDRLMESPQVYDASFLPTILIPEQRTVPHLREAAARYQADLLLVYRSACYSFERYRFFAADQTEGACTVEAVLLDVRTGLVPMSSIVSQSFSAEQNAEDFSFRETILRAQLAAVVAALGNVSGEIAEFLSGEG